MSQQYPPEQPPQWQGQPPQQSGTWQQQPNTGYQPQSGSQWQQQPPMQPGGYPPQPQKKSRRGLWITLGVVAVVLLALCIGIAAVINSAAKSVQTSVNTSLTAIATSVPTSAATTAATTSTSGGTWTTTHTFTGNGTKKTAIFNVGNDWKILYSCNGMIAGVATDGILSVAVYGSDGTITDPAAINATCKSGSALTKGETEEHQGGQVYLDINGTGDWTVIVQELK